MAANDTACMRAKVRREMIAQLGAEISIPGLPTFDGNMITPGTAFMARVADMLRGFLRAKLAADPAWAGTQVILSDAGEPGEGEHKVQS